MHRVAGCKQFQRINFLDVHREDTVPVRPFVLRHFHVLRDIFLSNSLAIFSAPLLRSPSLNPLCFRLGFDRVFFPFYGISSPKKISSSIKSNRQSETISQIPPGLLCVQALQRRQFFCLCMCVGIFLLLGSASRHSSSIRCFAWFFWSFVFGKLLQTGGRI